MFNLFKKSFCKLIDLPERYSCFSHANIVILLFFDFVYLILTEKIILEQSS
jgi:hypothetical protein